MDDRVLAAVEDNARWCALVCRAHGVGSTRVDGVWVASGRPPPLYPDAVTLRPDVDASTLLGRLGDRPTSAVKDAFAGLDLAGAGFAPLFDATWIHRPPGPDGEAPEGWRALSTPEELEAWTRAGGAPLPPAVLRDDSVRVLGLFEGGTARAGAVAARTGPVVGMSNVFGVGPALDVWAGAVAAVAARFPGVPMVGYERGDDLVAARAAGFVGTGPLRVWRRGPEWTTAAGATAADVRRP